jgi:Arc/MetJ-type ribon-helix-helix transcriptional regulator
MDIAISEQHLEHIRQKVDSGSYPSSNAVIAKALALLDEHDESLAEELIEVHSKVREGVDALKSGDYSECTDETLHELFDDVRRRGRERRSSGNDSRSR